MIKVKIKGDLSREIAAKVAASTTTVVKSAVEALRDATPVDTGEARDGWRLEKDAIVNDVEHVSFLNDGSSQQAPAYFIEQTLLSQKGVVPSGTIVRPQ